MTLFISTYTNKLDKKGRISIPAQFRAVIASNTNAYNNFSGIVAYASFVNKCIEACGMDRIMQISSSIDNLDPYSDRRDAFATTILGGSVQLAFDSEGRVSLPEHLLDIAGIKEQAIFVGKGQTFEIWNPDTFNEYYDKAREIAKKERASLHLSPQRPIPQKGDGE